MRKGVNNYYNTRSPNHKKIENKKSQINTVSYNKFYCNNV